VRSALFLEKVDLHLEPPDLLIQRRRQGFRIRAASGAAPLEAARGIFHQLPLPLRNLRRMHLVTRRQLAQRVKPFTASSATFALNSCE